MVPANKINKKFSLYNYPICGFVNKEMYNLPPCQVDVWNKNNTTCPEVKYVVWSDNRIVEFVCGRGRDIFKSQYKGVSYPFTPDLEAALNLVFDKKPDIYELQKFMAAWFKLED